MFRRFSDSKENDDMKNMSEMETKKSDEEMKSENTESNESQDRKSSPFINIDDRRMAFAQAAAESFEKNKLFDNFN
jgi:hypothetical protein